MLLFTEFYHGKSPSVGAEVGADLTFSPFFVAAASPIRVMFQSDFRSFCFNQILKDYKRKKISIRTKRTIRNFLFVLLVLIEILFSFGSFRSDWEASPAEIAAAYCCASAW